MDKFAIAKGQAKRLPRKIIRNCGLCGRTEICIAVTTDGEFICANCQDITASYKLE